ncbi:unnamed protein product [Symbiodinium sp. KB8]|nr:unnamed protein product [Symbiodinium sp. KB8]
MDRLISPAVDAATKANFCDDVSVVSRKRADTLSRWSARARELDKQEVRANSQRPAHLQKLLVGKRILLWKEILSEIGYPDTSILDEVEAGLPLTGWMNPSQVFQQRARPPTMSVSTVLAMNKGFHALVRRRLAKRQDPEVEEKTWRETEEELAKGWFWIDHSGSWEGKIIAHRFGLLQKLKLRTIDDCSVGGLNCTVGLPDKMRVHSIDILSSMLRRALELCGGRASCKWVGRTYDLQAAYRQFGIDSFTRELLRIAVNRPGSDEPVLLGANSLPFGAVGSVSGWEDGSRIAALDRAGRMDVSDNPSDAPSPREAVTSLSGLEQRLQHVERSFRDLERRLNTVQLRLCDLEDDLQACQAQLRGSFGIPLTEEVGILRRLVTELTEVSNRVSPEVTRLLHWRQRFTRSLQTQLMLISHQFQLACPQLDLNTLD